MFVFVQNDWYSILESWCRDCVSIYSYNLLFIKVSKKINFSYANAVFCRTYRYGI